MGAVGVDDLEGDRAAVLEGVDEARHPGARVIAVVLRGFAPVPASDVEREWTGIVPGSVHEAQYRRLCW